ncbi:hypothetical protein ABIE56_000407 [Luteibacter sp. 621]|uniref:hypothetical protein n=1 Tax=Luteibacter sp. 621 TaxID=3373916 RepID=UPI003D1CA1E7
MLTHEDILVGGMAVLAGLNGAVFRICPDTQYAYFEYWRRQGGRAKKVFDIVLGVTPPVDWIDDVGADRRAKRKNEASTRRFFGVFIPFPAIGNCTSGSVFPAVMP